MGGIQTPKNLHCQLIQPELAIATTVLLLAPVYEARGTHAKGNARKMRLLACTLRR